MSLLAFHDEGQRYSVVLEEDREVAYAYLRDGHEIVGDVWLYNVGPAPAEPEWGDPEKMPFRNPAAFVRPGALAPLAEPARWSCTFEGSEARVYCDGSLVARIVPGAKPGWSVLAAKAGPLALPLT
ncbi:MAG TPA: hypothetical protein VH417_12170 [Vicinamibacterales bacterium]|jgi:hypothetical protein